MSLPAGDEDPGDLQTEGRRMMYWCGAGLEGFQSLWQKTADGVCDTSSQWHLVLTVAFQGSVKLTVRAGNCSVVQVACGKACILEEVDAEGTPLFSLVVAHHVATVMLFPTAAL